MSAREVISLRDRYSRPNQDEGNELARDVKKTSRKDRATTRRRRLQIVAAVQFN